MTIERVTTDNLTVGHIGKYLAILSQFRIGDSVTESLVAGLLINVEHRYGEALEHETLLTIAITPKDTFTSTFVDRGEIVLGDEILEVITVDFGIDSSSDKSD
ncbi:hypothetical protein [Antrihabitans sp. YC2-6]|uniref:hypothetical protein n=1 Tax=Antrihabitans sp. YC2-6 TaxID=2799498 RepID=UPI0018F7A582|nr:hypothetical protein [Antrihabitans sp. YC2-6]MBJ8344289.1 hypothetical protein [Antrihabitans sp. YC2-6]